MNIIYIDMLLAVNLVIDYLLLCGTARVLSLTTARWRLLSGASVGALSSLLILLPPMPLVLSLAAKLGAALVMVPISFSVKRLSRFCKATLTLFLISALFAGVCGGLYWLCKPSDVLVQSGIVYLQLHPLLLLGMIVVSYGLLCLYDRFTRQRIAENADFRLDIAQAGHSVTLRAMFDSGHRLRESFSGAPVIIVSQKAIGTSYRDMTTRYIPFSSLGGNGVLPSFRPVHAVLHTERSSVTLDPIWIAVSDQLNNDAYDALIGPDLINLL